MIGFVVYYGLLIHIDILLASLNAPNVDLLLHFTAHILCLLCACVYVICTLFMPTLFVSLNTTCSKK